MESYRNQRFTEWIEHHGDRDANRSLYLIRVVRMRVDERIRLYVAHHGGQVQAGDYEVPQTVHSLQGLPCTGFGRPAFAEWVIDEHYFVAVTDIT